MIYRRPDQCLFCGSRRCRTRISALGGRYDEIACSRHIRDLEKHADSTLGVHNGVMRDHESSTSPLRRERNGHFPVHRKASKS